MLATQIFTVLLTFVSIASANVIKRLEKRDNGEIVYPNDRSIVATDFNVTVRIYKSEGGYFNFADLKVVETDTNISIFSQANVTMGTNVYNLTNVTFGSYTALLTQTYSRYNYTTKGYTSSSWTDTVLFTVASKERVDLYNESVKTRTVASTTTDSATQTSSTLTSTPIPTMTPVVEDSTSNAVTAGNNDVLFVCLLSVFFIM